MLTRRQYSVDVGNSGNEVTTLSKKKGKKKNKKKKK
jgi:hypothetical protein